MGTRTRTGGETQKDDRVTQCVGVFSCAVENPQFYTALRDSYPYTNSVCLFISSSTTKIAGHRYPRPASRPSVVRREITLALYDRVTSDNRSDNIWLAGPNAKCDFSRAASTGTALLISCRARCHLANCYINYNDLKWFGRFRCFTIGRTIFAGSFSLVHHFRCRPLPLTRPLRRPARGVTGSEMPEPSETGPIVSSRWKSRRATNEPRSGR